jgi:RHS repeat-associated protein
MTNDAANTLTYDAENRVLSATNGGSSGTYTYDGNSLRVKKVSASTTTVYIFSGSKVLAEYVNGAAPSAPTREYVYSGGAMLAKIEAGVTNYYHSDHLSARVITDSTGTVVGQRANYPYGETWYETGATTKIKFTSYERDSESGNDFALARYYVNRLGRFNAPDPLGGSISNPQSLNRYAYVLNSPVSLTDPLGLTTCDQNGNNCYDSVTVTADGGVSLPVGSSISLPGGGNTGGRQTKSLNAPPVGLDDGGGGTGSVTGRNQGTESLADCTKRLANAGSLQNAFGLQNSSLAGIFLGNNGASAIQLFQDIGKLNAPGAVNSAGQLFGSNLATTARNAVAARLPTVVSTTVAFQQTTITTVNLAVSVTSVTVSSSSLSLSRIGSAIVAGAANVLNVKTALDVLVTAYAAYLCRKDGYR